MKKQLAEQSILFFSILKWIVLSTAVGIVVGASTAFYLKILAYSVRTQNFTYYYLLLPIAMFLSSFIIKYFAPNAEGHGTEKVIEAVHKQSGKIRWQVIPIKLIATVVTIASGGSVGKEGPAAQIGGGESSLFADLLHFNDSDRKKFVICGISAGFAAVFGTPIAGAIFGVEVLFIGSILYDVLLPSFIAGIVSYQVAVAMGIRYFHHNILNIPAFSSSLFFKVLLLGIVFGLISFVLIETLKAGEFIADKIKIWKPLKGIIGGLVLVLFTVVFHWTRYLGLGMTNIHAALNGVAANWYDPFLKIVYTSITLSFGGSGGIVTPIFFIGATSGASLGHLFHLSVDVVAAIGMVSLLSGAANTPIAASIMAVELFGPALAPYAAIAGIVSYIMTGHRSVYPSQILAIKKSESIDVELGKEIVDTKIDSDVKNTSPILLEGKYIIKKMKNKSKKTKKKQ